MHVVHASQLALLPILLVTAFACDRAADKDRSPATTTTTWSSPLPGASGTSLAWPAADVTSISAGGVAPPRIARFSDEQTLEVLRTMNAGLVEQARIAQGRATAPAVRSYAEATLREHSEADAVASDIGVRNKLWMTASPLSHSIQSSANKTASVLAAQADYAFDRAYIESQVREHQAMLEAIDSTIMPSVTTGDLRALAQTTRNQIAHRLNAARDLERQIRGR